MSGADTLVTLNAGSSSIKFALYDPSGAEPEDIIRGQVQKLGTEDAGLEFENRAGERESQALGKVNHASALQSILTRTQSQLGNRRVVGVGHRIAHGGIDFTAACVLDDAAIEKLRTLEPLAPLHQPHNLAFVDAAREAFPGTLQVGCFDTAFHRGHPWVNDTFALPRRYYDQGVRRYGFHGLSYDYIMGALRERAPDIADKRIIVAHLGNGASMCAIHQGRSVASSMGFSALDGLPMGTRCGQLDPGVLLYLMDHEGMTSSQITTLLYKESGLKGLSGLTHDMRELEAAGTPEARQAIDYYVFRIRREIGAMAAVLGGLDGFVFCGGIGENARSIRRDICAGMEWIGIALDEEANVANDMRISSGATPVLVIPTNEEKVIARALSGFLKA